MVKSAHGLPGKNITGRKKMFCFPNFAEAGEYHFFDSSREYRRICRSTRRDVIEIVLTSQEEADMDPDLIFVEEVLVKPQYTEAGHIPSTLTIVNRYRYSEYDTIVLEDYRICY